MWLFCIPFLMRFRFTSAYEYLGHRFGVATRKLGVALFICMVVLWMGFVVLASARTLAKVAEVDLIWVILTVGAVATIYTMLGGLRAVIWTDVIQVLLLIGGGLFTILYVGWQTGSWIPDWYQTTIQYLERSEHTAMPWFSFDPTVRATVVTVALHMTVWHICTHVANQMTVQRYFSTSDVRAARRSFVTGSLFGVGLNLMLVVVGLAMLHFYIGQQLELDRGLSADRDRDLIFPTFAVEQLPRGFGGAILAALLAAAMSSIDSGVNSIATVLSFEFHGGQPHPKNSGAQIPLAKKITVASGLFITAAAYALSFLPEKWGIVGAMPRTFNAITAPLGGLFLVGIFIPRAGQRAVISGAFAGLVTAVTIGYFEQIGALLVAWGMLSEGLPAISFTWVMPCAMLMTLGTALVCSFIWSSNTKDLAGLTWRTRNTKFVEQDR